MKLIARFMAAFAVVAAITFALPQVVSATPMLFADAKSDICAGIGAAGGANGCAPSGPSVNRIITFAINTLSVIAGIAAVIMIIFAGLKYITSNGEAANINSAKTSLIYAIVGIVIVAVSQFLVQFVIAKVR